MNEYELPYIVSLLYLVGTSMTSILNGHSLFVYFLRLCIYLGTCFAIYWDCLTWINCFHLQVKRFGSLCVPCFAINTIHIIYYASFFFNLLMVISQMVMSQKWIVLLLASSNRKVEKAIFYTIFTNLVNFCIIIKK